MPGQKTVLVVDKLPAEGLKALEALGLRVNNQPDLTAEALPGAVADASILIVRSTKIKADAIAAAQNLQLIVRAGAGVDNIDTDAASSVGIFVANCPGKNAAAVAELAIGLLIALDRRIPHATQELREGTWNKKEFSKADGLKGRTLGVLGVGTIGEGVIRRAQALGMKVRGWSRSLTDERAAELGIARTADKLELARTCDAISVHLAMSADTHHAVDAAFLAAMKDRSILINTARGGIVDDAALVQAMQDKGLRAALDVYENEPGASDKTFAHPILALPGFIGTPHIGASTEQAQDAIADEAVRVVREFTQSGHVPNCVNLAERTPARWMLVVRHYDKVGVLAGIFDELRGSGINVQRTNNIVFQGAEAAVARIELDSEPSGETLKTLRVQEHVLSVEAVSLSAE